MEDLDHAISAAQRQLHWMPPWLFTLVLLAVALALAIAAHSLLVRLVRRALDRSDEAEFWRPLLIRTRRPTRFALMIVALSLAATAAPLPPGWTEATRHLLLIGFIVTLGWMTLTALDVGAAVYLRSYKVEVEDNLLARKHQTQVRILRRALATLVVIVTVGLALMTISGVRQWGVSLLAAGGAAGIIVGLALQPLLSNLIAGIQIAMTQPIRIDDALVVEGEWGNVEEISATYVVLRIWDQRRLILPLSYFIQNPFQNWTRESASLIGTAFFYVDYQTPVEAMRRKLVEIAKSTPLWDGRVVNLAVTDLKERTMEIRCLISGRNGGQTFDLRCLVREQMVAFLQAEHPQSLPRDRLEIEAPRAPAEPRTFADADARRS